MNEPSKRPTRQTNKQAAQPMHSLGSTKQTAPNPRLTVNSNKTIADNQFASNQKRSSGLIMRQLLVDLATTRARNLSAPTAALNLVQAETDQGDDLAEHRPHNVHLNCRTLQVNTSK